MSIIEVKNLCFNYPDKNILDNISFNLEKGDFLCIVGTNGTGKSTLLKLILNILKPNKGEIKILDTPSTKFDKFDKISYVSQKATGFNSAFPATVEEIVALGLYSKRGFLKLPNGEDKKKVKKALERVGMQDYAKRLIGQLSGGQQQRVFIAKALVNDPEIIFLDEPTVGIDITAVDSICCLLGELNQSGITIVMVTHDISSILYHSNKVLHLSEDGKARIVPSKEFNSETIFKHVHHSHSKEV